MAISVDHRVDMNKNDNIDKYKDLTRELRNWKFAQKHCNQDLMLSRSKGMILKKLWHC